MYDQRRIEANKTFERYEKQMRAAKQSGEKANQKKVLDQVKHTQKKKQGKKGGDSDEEQAEDAPARWNDYDVKFHFPEPTELSPPLMQLMDVKFGCVDT
jgi:ATP-binding cassette subfamily F protein 1